MREGAADGGRAWTLFLVLAGDGSEATLARNAEWQSKLDIQQQGRRDGGWSPLLPFTDGWDGGCREGLTAVQGRCGIEQKGMRGEEEGELSRERGEERRGFVPRPLPSSSTSFTHPPILPSCIPPRLQRGSLQQECVISRPLFALAFLLLVRVCAQACT